MPSDETTASNLFVHGALPAALSGHYWAAAEGTIHAVAVHPDRSVSYRNRRITLDASADVVATNLITFGRSVLAFGDGALAYELHAGDETARRVDLAGARRRLSARPKIDPVTGELHLVTFLTRPSQLHVSVSPGGLTRTVRSIDNAPSRIRELELTRDDVVFLADGFVGVTARSGVNPETTWFAIDRGARHIVAAFAHGESLDVHTTGQSLVRWTLHRRATTTVECQVLDATVHTFATSNPQPTGATCRFLWTVGIGAVHKHDLLTGARHSHDIGGGRLAGELLFVTDPDRRTTEDGGWLVGLVHDETRNASDFVVFDAQMIERPAIAIVPIPGRIPYGAHGTWIPTEQI